MNDLDRFQGDGFVHVRDAVPVEWLDAAEAQILALYRMQGRKIGEHREFILADDAPADARSHLAVILERLEAHDKEAAYQVQKFLPSSPALRLDDILVGLGAALLGSLERHVLIEGPVLFVSRPDSTRLLYHWHSEAHYYPKRQTFVKAWIPIFSARTEENGAMSVVPKSHICDWPFVEYTGYDEASYGRPNHFVQYEIPPSVLGGRAAAAHVCEAARGDLVLFDSNLVHRNNVNCSTDYAFAIVARVWDPSSDLTLSGTMAATPYGGDIGRPGLVIEP